MSDDVEKQLEDHQWDKASAQIERLVREYPNSEKALAFYKRYADLKDSDLNAVIAYLRTLPPVRNDIPTPRSLAFFPYLWAKFRMLILGDTVPVYIYAENAGSAQSAGPAPEHGVVPKEEHP